MINLKELPTEIKILYAIKTFKLTLLRFSMIFGKRSASITACT